MRSNLEAHPASNHKGLELGRPIEEREDDHVDAHDHAVDQAPPVADPAAAAVLEEEELHLVGILGVVPDLLVGVRDLANVRAGHHPLAVLGVALLGRRVRMVKR